MVSMVPWDWISLFNFEGTTVSSIKTILKPSASGFKIERRQSEATEVSTHSVSFVAEPNGAELLATKLGV